MTPRKFQGDVAFGDGLTLRFGILAQAEVQAALNMSLQSILKALSAGAGDAAGTEGEAAAFGQDPRLHNMVITMLWASLQQHHPELERRDVADLIDQYGLDAAFGALSDAITLSSPTASAGGKARKPRAMKTI